MSAWRVIITDSESTSGVAPVCDRPDVHAMMHGGTPDDLYVYSECCPHPHIETHREAGAAALAEMLTNLDAELCS